MFPNDISERQERIAEERIRYMMDGPDLRVVHLYSNNAALRNAVRDIIGTRPLLVEHVTTPSRKQDRVEEVHHEPVLPLPAEADFLVTKLNLSVQIERQAARLNAMPLVLPEAGDYLMQALERRQLLVLVGS